MDMLAYDTYPDMMKDYENGIENENYDNEVRIFTVERDWGEKWIFDNFKQDVEDFNTEYTWDDTFAMYEASIKDGTLIDAYIETYEPVFEEPEDR